MKKVIRLLFISLSLMTLAACASLDGSRQIASDCEPHHVHMDNEHNGHHHFGHGDPNSSAYSGQNMDRLHDQAEGSDC